MNRLSLGKLPCNLYNIYSNNTNHRESFEYSVNSN